MEICHLDNWDDFIEIIKSIRTPNEYDLIIDGRAPDVLFRGQPDSNDDLETTLERIGKFNYSAREYDDDMAKAKNSIDSLGIVDLAITSSSDFSWNYHNRFDPPNFDVMAFLRHHSFPSPLLDWSASPYVAVAFAIISARPRNCDRFAVYAFRTGSISPTRCSSEECIIPIRTTAKLNKRHFIQQSQFTICIKESGAQDVVFCSHTKGFNNFVTGPDIPSVYKLTLPWSAANKIRKELGYMNISPFTLLGTTDSLLATLSQKIFVQD